MNEASRWRLELARRIAPGYSDNSKVSVVVVAGSVGRGTADRFSDVEAELHRLLEETITLAETHLPGIDLTGSRDIIRHQRPVWERAPETSVL